jgi:glycerol-3-phosphate dehydrogenase
VVVTPPETHLTFDVAIIGAGVVGCAIAQRLSRYDLEVAILESADDVGTGTSKANSAILHTGFDAQIGSLESRLVARGHRLLTDYAASVGIPLIKTGATMVAWTLDDATSLRRVQADAAANGYDRIVALTKDEVYRKEAHLGPGVVAGLSIPDESIICPFTTPLALATDAVVNGVVLKLNSAVASGERTPGGTWRLETTTGAVEARWVINAAGLEGDLVAHSLGDGSPAIRPRRGQFVILDKAAAGLIEGIVLGVPDETTKGILLAPTVFGNLLLGPTAEDIEDKSATETTSEGLSSLLRRGAEIVPGLAAMEVTSVYSGLRAVNESGGYDIAVDRDRQYVRALGIRSTGLSACMAIAEYLLDLLADAGLALRPKSEVKATTVPYLGEDRVRPTSDPAAIAEDPGAGTVVCFCERTTLADLETACSLPIPPTSLGGLFRRTRAMGGRCQGFYCGARVTTWLAGQLDVSPGQLLGLGQR